MEGTGFQKYILLTNMIPDILGILDILGTFDILDISDILEIFEIFDMLDTEHTKTTFILETWTKRRLLAPA